MDLPCTRFSFLSGKCFKGMSGFVTGCYCGAWCHGLTNCPLYVDPFSGKSIINKLAHGFARMRNRLFFTVFILYVNGNCLYILLSILVCLFCLYRTSPLNYKLTGVLDEFFILNSVS